MDKEKKLETTQQAPATPEEASKARFQKFLDRLTIFRAPRLPVRNWLAILGIVLFLALVIAYYAINGG